MTARHAGVASRRHQRGESPNDAEIDRLARVARRLLKRAGPNGVTMADVRLHVGLDMTRRDRALSYLHAVFPRADGVATCLFRRSPIPGQRGIIQLIWVGKDFFDRRRHGPAPTQRRSA